MKKRIKSSSSVRKITPKKIVIKKPIVKPEINANTQNSGIKHLAPQQNSKYMQGYFTGAKKYFGPEPIIYRSSLEYRFIVKLELNSEVEKWSSEQVVIPYTMKKLVDGKFVIVRKNYNTDFTVIMKDGKKYIIEVKPKSLVPLNESQIKRNPAIYKNSCKWNAAIKWCKQNGYIFKIITEEHLTGKVF
jgi:hypothetical protein